jgi:hypothetical protein
MNEIKELYTHPKPLQMRFGSEETDLPSKELTETLSKHNLQNFETFQPISDSILETI